MRRKQFGKATHFLCALALFLLFALRANAFDDFLVLSPESDFHLEGKSNLHSYSIRATGVHAVTEWSPPPSSRSSFEKKLDQKLGKRHLQKFEISIPVQEMKSGKNGLDRNMEKALKGTEYPVILFELHDYEVRSEVSENRFDVHAHGWLTVAGTRRSIDISAEIEVSEDRVVLQGEQPLSMLDFNIVPPTALGGMLKTNPRVLIHFHLIFTKQERGVS